MLLGVRRGDPRMSGRLPRPLRGVGPDILLY